MPCDFLFHWTRSKSVILFNITVICDTHGLRTSYVSFCILSISLAHNFLCTFGLVNPLSVLAWPKPAPARHHKTGGHFLISYLFHLLIRAIFHSYNFSIGLLMYVFINNINFLANSNMVHSHEGASFRQS